MINLYEVKCWLNRARGLSTSRVTVRDRAATLDESEFSDSRDACLGGRTLLRVMRDGLCFYSRPRQPARPGMDSVPARLVGTHGGSPRALANRADCYGRWCRTLWIPCVARGSS